MPFTTTSDQCLQTGTCQDEAIGHYAALNVGRFMRNNFSNKEMFRNIFLNQGGYPHVALLRLLEPQNTGRTFVNIVKQISLMTDIRIPVEVVFDSIKSNLRKFGSLIIENFQVFLELYTDKLAFSGSWNDKFKFTEKEMPNTFHSLLIMACTPHGRSQRHGWPCISYPELLEGKGICGCRLWIVALHGPWESTNYMQSERVSLFPQNRVAICRRIHALFRVEALSTSTKITNTLIGALVNRSGRLSSRKP